MNLDPLAFVADPQLMEALERKSSPVACNEDRVLFRQGDSPFGLYLFQKGEVTLSMESDLGAILFVVQAHPGSLLGLPGLIGNEPYSLTATACSGAQLRFVSREEFIMLMQSSAALALKVLEVLAAEVRSARNAIAPHSHNN